MVAAMTMRMLICAVVMGWAAPSLAQGVAQRVRNHVDAKLPLASSEYRWFHAHPELSGQEKNTAARLAAGLRKIGLEVHEGIGGHGVVGILRARNPRGPVVIYRADMDGLPITEATGVPYASKTVGVMHGCGHDVHMATALGTLSILKAMSGSWSGTVLFIGQPAEEVGKGARAMLADARFKRILKRVGKPRVALALHDAADVPAGSVSLLAGYAHANVDSVDIIVHGKGGHGARPHETIDPVVIGAEIVLALQTIVSRRLPPGEKAVVTVGKFSAGTKHNIISPRAELLLTVRSYSDKTRKALLTEIRRVAVNIARAHRAPKPPTVTVLDEFTPAAYNDPKWTQRISERLAAVLGKARVKTHTPSLGGEDFGMYARTLRIPGMMYKLGAQNAARFRGKNRDSLPGLHSDKWAPDVNPTLRTGMLTMTLAILEAFGTR